MGDDAIRIFDRRKVPAAAPEGSHVHVLSRRDRRYLARKHGRTGRRVIVALVFLPLAQPQPDASVKPEPC